MSAVDTDGSIRVGRRYVLRPKQRVDVSAVDTWVDGRFVSCRWSLASSMYRFIYLGLYAEARSGHLKRATRTLNTAEWHGARCLNGGTLAALIAQLDHGFANISRNISRILLRSISRIFSRVRELDSRIREYRPSNSRIRRLEHIQLPSPPSNVPYHCSLSLSLSLSRPPAPLPCFLSQKLLPPFLHTFTSSVHNQRRKQGSLHRACGGQMSEFAADE